LKKNETTNTSKGKRGAYCLNICEIKFEQNHMKRKMKHARNKMSSMTFTTIVDEWEHYD
jgi:hypothetical protein